MEIVWNDGVDNYRKHTLMLSENKFQHRYELELLDTPLPETHRSLLEIVNDLISVRQTKTVEVLYSGGMDSELVLSACHALKVPLRAITMRLMTNGYPINTHDIYYSERYCRAKGIEQKFIDLDIELFYKNGEHLSYLRPYYISEPHVATHFWLFEQCTGFPVLGGEYSWPWSNRKAISPHRHSYSQYDRFLADRGIHGIGNMLNSSLELNLLLIRTHLNLMDSNIHDTSDKYIPIFKCDLREKLNLEPAELRMKHYGWEGLPKSIFDKTLYCLHLQKEFGVVQSKIIWNNAIGEVLGIGKGSNEKYK